MGKVGSHARAKGKRQEAQGSRCRLLAAIEFIFPFGAQCSRRRWRRPE
jgi:hypothetical protein